MDKSRALALVLRLTAVAFIVVFTLLFLASVTRTDTPEFLYRLFAWGDIGDAEEQMLAAVYIVWGVCLWIAARAPLQHRLFIDFTITANLAHAAVMAVQSFTYQGEHAHLWGDVVILFAAIGVLAALWLPVRNNRPNRPHMPRSARACRCPGVLVSMTVKPKDRAVAAARCLA